MARLFHAGAELAVSGNSITGGLSPDGSFTAAVMSRDTATFRSGAASWKATSTGAGASGQTTGPGSYVVDGRTYYLRAYFKITDLPTNNKMILSLGGVTRPGDIHAQLISDGTVKLFAGGALQGSASAAINDGNWHRIELKGVATATSLWTAAELQIDGTSIATWSGSVTRGGGLIVWGWLTLDTTGTVGNSKVINIDDVALNDSTGATNNTWPGSGNVVLLKPTADSAVGTGWTNDAAGTSSLFLAVRNTPPAGIADTSAGTGLAQIRNATSNANVNYDATMTTYTAAGIGASDTINALVEQVCTAAPVTTSSKQGTFGIVSNPTVANVALDATGTAGAFWSGVTAGTWGTGWKWSTGATQELPTVTLGTAPVCRLTQVTASTRIAMCCAMIIYVDYTPGIAAAATVMADSFEAIPFIPLTRGA